MLSGCGRFLQYALFIVNFVLMVGGILLMGVGTWTAIHKYHAAELMANVFSITWLLVIILGALITLLSFIGCCGAFKESKCLLITFFIFLLFVFAVFVASIICAFVFKDNIEEYIYDRMLLKLERYGGDNAASQYKPEEKVTDAWDNVQKDLGCCGIKQYNDWSKNSHFNTTGKARVPQSCCRNKGNECQLNPSDMDTFSKGCLVIMIDFFVQNIYLLAGIAIAAAVLMVLSMTFACILYMMI